MMDPITLEGTSTVIVREPCTCGASRWFYCRCATIAEYEIATFDTVPNRAHLAQIRAAHPGMDLIYYDPAERGTP